MPKAKISPAGTFTRDDFNAWFWNVIGYSIPIYVSTVCAQLAVNVQLKQALITSLPAFYGAIADYIGKKNEVNRYEKR